MHDHFAVHLFGVLALFAALAGCGSKDSELSTAIADCQLDAHREIVESKNQSEQNRKFALGVFSDSCLKKKGFRPSEKTDCLIEPTSADGGRSFVKASIECWLK